MTAALCLGGIVAVLAILWMARKAGADGVKANIGEQNAKTAEKVADAVASAPDSLSAVREHVRNGGQL